MKTAELVETECRDVAGENMIQLPFGLLGFERVKNYVLLSRPHEEPFMWLQMLGEDNKSFLVISPFRILPNYQPDVSNEDVHFLGLDAPGDAIVLNIVTLNTAGQATINLKGPVVINRHTLVGKQIIPNNASKFDLRHPLPLA